MEEHVGRRAGRRGPGHLVEINYTEHLQKGIWILTYLLNSTAWMLKKQMERCFHLIHPVDLNSFFGDDGKIYGYEGLKMGSRLKERKKSRGRENLEEIEQGKIATIYVLNLGY